MKAIATVESGIHAHLHCLKESLGKAYTPCFDHFIGLLPY
jgi:hypothetical protein